MEYPIGTEAEGMTLKTYLFSVLGLSGSMVKELKKDPMGLLVNGAHVTVRQILHAGDCLTAATEDDHASETIVPTEMPLTILYEDRDILVINKPPYMPTHPSHGHYEDTLANGLMAYFEKKGEPFVFRSCSRLDRDTSGVVTIAKNRQSAYQLHRQHLAGQVEKWYLAVLEGNLLPDAGDISGCIRRETDSVITRVLTEEDGALSLTRYRVLARAFASGGRARTLVLAQPVTGRTHQLRVHFASRGCPIAGDFLYGQSCSGENTAFTHIGRQALHAVRTSFFHPTAGERMTLSAGLPDDFAALLHDFPEKRFNFYAKTEF